MIPMPHRTPSRSVALLGVALASTSACLAAAVPASAGTPTTTPQAANGAASTSHQAAEAKRPSARGWKLVAHENFSRPVRTDRVGWVRDPQGSSSAWNVDHLDDDGEFFDVKGGADFRTQLAAADVLRKRVPFGKDGWLTVELAARSYDKNGVPHNPPRLEMVRDRGERSARINEPSHDGGIIIRNTRPLPSRYRIEYTLRSLDFGGKRNGSWEYDGKVNGYDPKGVKTNWPWKRAGDFTGPTRPDNPQFGDVRAENGFYFLSIMDYDKPAPHNNIFIHNHRKVGMDMYNVSGSWAKSYAACNPATGKLIPYPDSTANGINAIFFDGSRFRMPAIAYNEFLMETECGFRDGADPKATIVSAAEIRPEVMPNEPYHFAIERTGTGYTMEMSGNFKYVGKKTLRYHRDFVQDGRPIWHYNQTPHEYDGSFNSTLTFDGPFGSYSKEQWPAGSAYPDYFIIGDPHLNYYEGKATIDDIRMSVPASSHKEH